MVAKADIPPLLTSTPAEAGVQLRTVSKNVQASPNWTPACAGVVWWRVQRSRYRWDGKEVS